VIQRTTGRLARRAWTVLGWLFGIGIAVLLGAPQASAHAVVVGSDPADGSRLAKAPTSVTVRFDEPVGLQLGYLRVVDQAGRRVDTGTASHPGGNGAAVTVALKAGLSDSSYLASFRVVSADSHPIAGSIRFVVGNGPLSAAPSSSGTPVNRTVMVSLAVVHWLSFAGVAIIGGSWLIFSLWPSGQGWLRIRRLIWGGWYTAAIATVAEYLVQGPYAAGSGPGSIAKWNLLDATLHENTGQLLSLRLLLLGIIAAVLTALLSDDDRRPSWAPEAAAIVGVGVIVTFAASGHSQSADPRWFAVLVDALHLSSMVIWLGGLVYLALAAFTRTSDSAERDELAAGLPIFSRVALISIVTLAVTGTIQAWRELGTVDAITTTWYGRLVITKVVLFLGLVGLGYLARRILAHRLQGYSTLIRLRRALLAEVVVGAIVLAVSGVLIAQPPGKVSLATIRAKPRHVGVAVSNSLSADVSVSPGTRGPVQVSISLTGTGNPLTVTATASLPSKSLGPIAVPLQAIGPRSYTASDVLLPSSGDWQINFVVKTSEFDASTAVAKLHIS